MKITHRDLVTTCDSDIKGTYTDIGTLDANDTVFYEDESYVPLFTDGKTTLLVKTSALLELPNDTELHVINVEESEFDYYKKDSWTCEVEKAPRRAKCARKKVD